MIYERETFESFIKDAEPLLEEHYKEIALYQDDIEYAPDFDAYRVMEAAGILHIMTAREDGVLLGYCVSFVHRHPHYKNDIFAINDVLYVHPEYRHGEVSGALLESVEEEMTAAGVSVMTFHMKTHKPFEALMDHLEYDKAEYLYSKLIK